MPEHAEGRQLAQLCPDGFMFPVKAAPCQYMISAKAWLTLTDAD